MSPADIPLLHPMVAAPQEVESCHAKLTAFPSKGA